jgi:hypothetical protein
MMLNLLSTLHTRVEKHRGPMNLVSYDGSLFDRIVHRVVTERLDRARYKVICAIRPCMDPLLRADVAGFARANGIDLVGYRGDCEVDKRTETIADAKCCNVQPRLQASYDRDGTVFFSAGPSRDKDLRNIAAAGARHGSRAIEYDSETGVVIWSPNLPEMENYKTVLLLHGLSPEEIIACYQEIFGQQPEAWRIAQCYVSCYFEKNKGEVRKSVQSRA